MELEELYKEMLPMDRATSMLGYDFAKSFCPEWAEEVVDVILNQMLISFRRMNLVTMLLDESRYENVHGVLKIKGKKRFWDDHLFILQKYAEKLMEKGDKELHLMPYLYPVD